MRENYKIVKPTDKVTIEIEKDVIEILKVMENHTKLTVSELANTAIKRFISSHKDFMPADYKKPKL